LGKLICVADDIVFIFAPSDISGVGLTSPFVPKVSMSTIAADVEHMQFSDM
jgi:hypothetical protein